MRGEACGEKWASPLDRAWSFSPTKGVYTAVEEQLHRPSGALQPTGARNDLASAYYEPTHQLAQQLAHPQTQPYQQPPAQREVKVAHAIPNARNLTACLIHTHR